MVSSLDARLARHGALAPTALRIALGAVFLAHAYAKAFVFTFPGTVAFFAAHGFPGWTVYPVFAAELLGGLALVMTHHTSPLAALPTLSGPAPQLFFAPAQIERLRKEWGAAELESRVSAAQQVFLESAQAWLTFEYGQGRDAIESAYRNVLAGRAAPERALVLSF